MNAVAAARTRALAVPAWAWLTGIVVLSAVVRIAIGRRVVAPWIMVDEIVYSELAKNVAAHGEFLVRGVPSHGYGFVYPVLVAPAWALFTSIPSAYAAAKGINAVTMSLAAIPAYFLARRILTERLALLAAGLTVLVPAMLYTGVLMTENAFYPIFLLTSLVLVVTLERPTALRQIGLLALCALAFETRAQAVALFAVVATAPLLLGLVERRGLRGTIRPFAWLYGLLGAGAILAVAVEGARGRSPLALLGAYQAATSTSYTPQGILRFFLYHWAGLDLAMGVLPFAALLAMWLAPRRPTAAGRAFTVASLSISVWLVAEVASFASAGYVDRIEERNMFYLVPFGLIALLGLAADGVVPRGRRPIVLAAVVAGVLPVFIPFGHFITTSALSDSFFLMPWWWAQDHLIRLQQVRWAAFAVALVAAALFALLPRRYALVLPALVAVYFVLTAIVVESGRHGIHKATVGSLWAGTHMPHRNWIDREVGSGARVAILWTKTMPTPYPVYENEFFSRAVRTVYDVDGAHPPDPLPEVTAIQGAGGALMTGPGQPLRAQYVLSDVEVGGKRIATDPVGVALYRVDGPVVILNHVTGLYPNDTWSGKTVTYRRVECAGGSLAVQLQADESLFKTPQTVVATEHGNPIGRTVVPLAGITTMTVPLVSRNGVCTVRFTVGRTAVPGPGDRRALGAHFLSFTPSR
jgi:Dolichyl-phosphate-mannose-protein mannosyltransferase